LPQRNQNACIENLFSSWPSFLLDCSIETAALARSYTNIGLSFTDVVSNLAYCCLTGYTVGFPQVTALGENYLMEKANGYNLKRLYGWLLLTLWSRFFLKSPQSFTCSKNHLPFVDVEDSLQ